MTYIKVSGHTHNEKFTICLFSALQLEFQVKQLCTTVVTKALKHKARIKFVFLLCIT